MTNTTPTEKLRSFAEECVRIGECSVKQFQVNLEKNPSYAFSWSGSAFHGAAQIEVGRAILTWFERGSPESSSFIESVTAEILDQVVRGSRQPARSTSPFSNEMERETASVWAEAYDKIRGRL